MFEKANADLEPDLMSESEVRDWFVEYERTARVIEYGRAKLARRLDAGGVAKMAGTSVGKAKIVVETGKALEAAPEVALALQGGRVSLDQATEIARAEGAQPGSSNELLRVAKSESFQVLRERSRRVVLEAAQRRGLGERQREARSARSHTDELGMFNLHLRFQPHVGAPMVNRAEAEASRLYRAAKKTGEPEPFERYLADAYAAIFTGAPSKKAPRPELVMLVSYEISKRGWKNVREGEVCKIPGLGPVSPEAAKEIAEDAFLTGLFYDGKDLRQMKRYGRYFPVEIRLALELGDPPVFDGMKCVDCGSRFKNERDHVEPDRAGGPVSLKNIKPRCDPCHDAKTLRDMRAGKFTGRVPDG